MHCKLKCNSIMNHVEFNTGSDKFLIRSCEQERETPSFLLSGSLSLSPISDGVSKLKLPKSTELQESQVGMSQKQRPLDIVFF